MPLVRYDRWVGFFAVALTIVPRTEWQDPKLPVTGPPIIKYKVKLIPAHYTAAVVIPDGDHDPTNSEPAAVASYLRAIQRDYKNRKPTGYSIGYNFAIDQDGQAWECRGFDIKCAANVGRNDETLAILCMVNGNDRMHDKMVTTFRALAAEAQRQMGHSLTVVCHCDIGKTQCPGAGIKNQVEAGLLSPADIAPTPTPTPTPRPKPQPGDNSMTIRILESQSDPKEFNAVFYAECDSKDRSIEVQWTGDGNDARVMERLNLMDSVFGPRINVSLAGLVNNRLHPKHKPSDINDGLHHWTEADFAP